MMAYFFSNGGLLFLNRTIVVSPIFFNFEHPVTYLMWRSLSYNQILLLVTHWYTLHNKDSRGKIVVTSKKQL